MSRQAWAWTLASAAGLTGITLGAMRQQTPEPQPELVSQQRVASVSRPQSASLAEDLGFLEAFVRGEAPPPGYSINEDHGTVKILYTGLVNSVTGARQSVAVVRDDTPDLQLVTLAVDGALVRTATHANGLIEDIEGGPSVATMSFWLSPGGGDVEAAWDDEFGNLTRYAIDFD